jgi:AcrR family transcriptional regulator
MPAHYSFTKDRFVEAAFEIVRTKGWDKLSARSLARALNCSTMPIYSYLKSMKDLRKELRKKAVDLLVSYQTTPKTGQIFFDMGLGYVSFAKKEKNLFRFLYSERDPELRHRSAKKSFRGVTFETLIRNMRADPALAGLDEAGIKNVLTKMWIFVHGLAFLANDNAFTKEEESGIEKILEETGEFILHGEKEQSGARQGERSPKR